MSEKNHPMLEDEQRMYNQCRQNANEMCVFLHYKPGKFPIVPLWQADVGVIGFYATICIRENLAIEVKNSGITVHIKFTRRPVIAITADYFTEEGDYLVLRNHSQIVGEYPQEVCRIYKPIINPNYEVSA